jgi:hypothetical protein
VKKAVCALLIALPLPALAEWKLMETSKDGDHFYYDPATLERDGDLVRVWMMSDMHAITTTGRFSFRHQHEFDCRAPQHRTLRSESYVAHMASGKPRDWDDTPGDWHDFAPGSGYDKDRKLFCAK